MREWSILQAQMRSLDIVIDIVYGAPCDLGPVEVFSTRPVGR